MGTLSKAVGSLGGYCAAAHTIIDYLKNRSRPFIYTTSLPAPVCAASYEGIACIEEERDLRDNLWENIGYIKEKIQLLGYDIGESDSAIIPIILGEEERALSCMKHLFDAGLYVPAIRYPTVPRGRARIRVSVSAEHTQSEMDKLIACLDVCKKGAL